jgi:hypothetical protein
MGNCVITLIVLIQAGNHKAGNAMVIENTTYGAQIERIPTQDGDQHLQEIISQVQGYFFNFESNWFYLFLAKSYYHKCHRSWTVVNTHLETFLEDPKTHYSLLMVVLELEMEKFHPRSFYCKQLKALLELISAGPSFKTHKI